MFSEYIKIIESNEVTETFNTYETKTVNFTWSNIPSNFESFALVGFIISGAGGNLIITTFDARGITSNNPSKSVIMHNVDTINIRTINARIVVAFSYKEFVFA